MVSELGSRKQNRGSCVLASWRWRGAPLAQVLALSPLEVSGPAKKPSTANPGRISENSLFLGNGRVKRERDTHRGTERQRQTDSGEVGSLLTFYMIWEAQFALFQAPYFALLFVLRIKLDTWHTADAQQKG